MLQDWLQPLAGILNFDPLRSSYLIFFPLNQWDWVMFRIAGVFEELNHVTAKFVGFTVKSVVTCVTKSGMW